MDGWKRGASSSCPAVPAGAVSPHVYPAGCAWWHDFESNTKHFIKNCDNPVPGWECLPAESHCWNQTRSMTRSMTRVAGTELAAIPIGANYSCDMAPSDTSACQPYMAHLNRSGTSAKTLLFDFGQNFAGLTQIKVKALPKGTRLLVRHAEFLSPCGDVQPQQCPVAEPSGDTMFEGGWPCAPKKLGGKDMDQDQGGNQGNQTTLFISNGGAIEMFTPSFSYYGFRYASISGLPADYTPDKETLTALRVNTRVEQTSKLRFNASVDVLNKIQNAVLYTQMSNIHSHPEDCPQVRACLLCLVLPTLPLRRLAQSCIVPCDAAAFLRCCLALLG